METFLNLGLTEQIVGQVILALVGLVSTGVIGLIGWATVQVREYFKLRKIEVGRTILDSMIDNAKKAITPEMLEQGQDALADYLTGYILRNGNTTRKKLKSSPEQLRERMGKEAGELILARQKAAEERQLLAEERRRAREDRRS